MDSGRPPAAEIATVELLFQVSQRLRPGRREPVVERVYRLVLNGASAPLRRLEFLQLAQEFIVVHQGRGRVGHIYM